MELGSGHYLSWVEINMWSEKVYTLERSDMLCNHEYEIIVKTKTPIYDIGNSDGMSEYLAERLLFGVTTVLLKCKKCNNIRKNEMLGIE